MSSRRTFLITAASAAALLPRRLAGDPLKELTLDDVRELLEAEGVHLHVAVRGVSYKARAFSFCGQVGVIVDGRLPQREQAACALFAFLDHVRGPDGAPALAVRAVA